MSRQILWEDLDLPKFYFWGPLVFLGIRCVSYPVNLVKTRLMVQTGKGVYRGSADAFRKVLKTEGPRGFYKGFPVFAIGVLVGQVYITAYELSKSYCSHLHPLLQGLVPGGLASVASQTLSLPLDIVSQRLMIQGMADQQAVSVTESVIAKSCNMCSVVQQIWIKDGLTGFHRGFGISLMTQVPTSGVWWGSYNFMVERSAQYCGADSEGRNRLPVQAACGVLSGILSATLTNPLDVIKTRIQVGGSRSIVTTLKTLWQEEGLGMFKKGLSARMMHVSGSSLLMIVGYETVKKLSVKTRDEDCGPY